MIVIESFFISTIPPVIIFLEHSIFASRFFRDFVLLICWVTLIETEACQNIKLVILIEECLNSSRQFTQFRISRYSPPNFFAYSPGQNWHLFFSTSVPLSPRQRTQLCKSDRTALSSLRLYYLLIESRDWWVKIIESVDSQIKADTPFCYA